MAERAFERIENVRAVRGHRASLLDSRCKGSMHRPPRGSIPDADVVNEAVPG
jgi:hypothetical protein